MRMMLCISFLCGLLGACASPHAARVRCDSHLVPINPHAGEPTNPLASTGNPPAAGPAAGASLPSNPRANGSAAP